MDKKLPFLPHISDGHQRCVFQARFIPQECSSRLRYGAIYLSSHSKWPSNLQLFGRLITTAKKMRGKNSYVDVIQRSLDKAAACVIQHVVLPKAAWNQHMHLGPNTPPTLLFPNMTNVLFLCPRFLDILHWGSSELLMLCPVWTPLFNLAHVNNLFYKPFSVVYSCQVYFCPIIVLLMPIISVESCYFLLISWFLLQLPFLVVPHEHFFDTGWLWDHALSDLYQLLLMKMHNTENAKEPKCFILTPWVGYSTFSNYMFCLLI